IEDPFVHGAPDVDLPGLPVNIRPLESKKLAESHAGTNGGEEKRVVKRLDLVENLVHVLCRRDLDLRVVVLAKRLRPANGLGSGEAINRKVSDFHSVREKLVE